MAAKSDKLTRGLLGAAYQHRAKDILSARFIVPPFSVLNTREGFWQERKRAWISLGIKSELGRGASLQPSGNDLFQNGNSDYRAGMAKTFNTGAPGTLGKAMKGANKLAKVPSGRIVAQHYKNNEKDDAKFAALRGSRKEVGQRLKFRDAAPGGAAMPATNYSKSGKRGDGAGRELDPDNESGGTSIFDPVLCELVYRWFAPPEALILDPFAGGSVRGIVAGEMGHNYFGIDLSERQLAANREQAATIGTTPAPQWFAGNSAAAICEYLTDQSVQDSDGFDLAFTCPPYGSLERYSDDPDDLSTQDEDQFNVSHASVIMHTAQLLKEGAFAVWVVGDYRRKDGTYANLPGETIRAFQNCGMHLYNTCILVNATGSLPLRINNQFIGSRKLGTTHQMVLVFCKGQPRDFVPKWGVEL